MKTLSEQIKTAQKRYFIAQLVALFLSGIITGFLIGWSLLV